MTTQAGFDLKIGDAIFCRDGRFEHPFTVARVERGHVAVDVGEGIAMPLPLRALETGRVLAAI